MTQENEGVIVESSATETETTEAVKTEESATSENEAASAKENAVTEGESAAPQKPDAKARIRQLHAEREKAREEAAYWRGKAENKVEPEKPAVASVNNGPTPDQFATYEEYLDARADYRAEQKYKALEAERERKAKESEAKTREEQVEATFREKVQGFKAKAPDFDEVMQNPSLRISATMYEAIRETDNGAEIAYHLGKNPQEAARIATLTPIAAIREIGKLEAKLTSTPAQTTTNKISNAPPPPSTVQGNAPATKDPSKMTDEEWYAYEKAEKLKKMQAKAQR